MSEETNDQGRGEWASSPITTGGGIMMGIGIIVAILAGMGTASADTTADAITAGFWLLGGILLFGFGFLARMSRFEK